MPVSTSTRSSTARATSSFPFTPSRNSLNPMSPSSASSYAPTVTSAEQAVKLNVVTRIAIEGKAKRGEEGASIKMYMKLAIPVDSITPGSTVALFPEENVKILTSQVHPLDSNSVPYNFSSSASPLLHNAARALNLPARLPTTFDAVYQLSSNPVTAASAVSASRSPESEDPVIPPVDSHYTGQILVSGYSIAFVLPRFFPSRQQGRQESEYGQPLHNKRRLSVGDRNHAHFMAAVDMWVPYVTRPPRFPYHLSIPTPRCLHNNIRLRIFSPSNTAASFASLSSVEEDSNSWDLTSDPHVTRTTSNRLARTGSYNHFADDESSDSSTTGFPDGFGIQGTFPSTDRVRVRWAKPMKFFEGAAGSGDVRRRVGVKDVKGEILCVVRGKRRHDEDGDMEGIVMDIEYKASCKGIWFPGVATLLGMDVGLVAKNADVKWFDESSSEWTVSGSGGYTGFGVAGTGRMSNQHSSRASSVDSQSQSILVSPADDPFPLPSGRPKDGPSSVHQSLLRAPLPSQNIAEYSFEGLNDVTASHLGTISSVSSLLQSTSVSPPGAPLTLHVNMNDVLPPNKTPFTFTIRGTILVTPRLTVSRVNGIHTPNLLLDYAEITEPINLPHFSVLAADAETTKIIVRNEIEGSNIAIEVYSPSGDISKDPQTRKTVLQKGGSTRCSEGGGRIALKTVGGRHDKISSAHPRTPIRSPLSRVSPSTTRPLNHLRQIRPSPLLIHSVKAVVTPLVSPRSFIPDAYAVRIHLSTPVNTETEWLEFGLARIGPSSSRTSLPDNDETCSPKVQIAGASVDGVSVQYAITDIEKQPLNGETLPGAPFERVEGTEWVNWVKIQVGPSTGDKVVIDYIVTDEQTGLAWFLSRNKGKRWDLLLPTFTLPIRRLHVKLKSVEGFTCLPIHSNLGHQHTNAYGQSLLNFAQGELFSPRVCLSIKPTKSRASSAWLWFTNALLLLCLLVTHLYQKIDLSPRVYPHEPLKHQLNQILADLPEAATVTVTLATTVTDCPSSSRHPTSYPMGSSSPSIKQGASSMTLSTATLSSITSFISSAAGSAPFSAPTVSRHELSPNLDSSLWEKLGLENLRARLEFISLPDLSVSSTKETLTRYGRTIWEVVEYLLFS
ncbi:hypothetical protein D9756_001440 [Leucocoprinus leucothites]|uniref:Uncharacterized protein n=1 Tax=Leucocoprinus leucothites TaxID=201217 RepID=A0A8H5G4M9_9AGAR|nr:hypothetical protein D9756_001440 [Leucoagaricus leucothites]